MRARLLLRWNSGPWVGMMSRLSRRFAGVVLALSVLVAGPGVAFARSSESTSSAGWTGGWSASMQRPDELFDPHWAVQGFADQTVRQVVRVSAAGSLARIRLSNVYGTASLHVAGASIARSGDGAEVRPGSLRPLTFDGSRDVTIDPGRELVSDPVPMRVDELESLTVTLYFDEPSGPVPFHAMASATSYRAAGNQLADRGDDAFGDTSQSWYVVSGVEVLGALPHRPGVVAFGDSITDGTMSTADANNRYPDELAERLEHRRRPVLNAGIGGNRVLNDSRCAGDDAMSRFERDVLGQPGVGSVIVLEGINDIGLSEVDDVCSHPNPRVTAEQLIAGHRELIRQAHAAGIKAIGATLLPFKGADYYTERGEAVRDELNHWIRTSGEYDEVIDFDRELAAPWDADLLDPAYDSGDQLHPNDAGYRAMAEAIDPAQL